MFNRALLIDHGLVSSIRSLSDAFLKVQDIMFLLVGLIKAFTPRFQVVWSTLSIALKLTILLVICLPIKVWDDSSLKVGSLKESSRQGGMFSINVGITLKVIKGGVVMVG